ncbi:MAG: hypothetical protein Q8R48_08160, partial [Candidatus Omnitrophota bacterium]|nr:hypothetical protein [Candidatus Omnitrophota bacterium]
RIRCEKDHTIFLPRIIALDFKGLRVIAQMEPDWTKEGLRIKRLIGKEGQRQDIRIEVKINYADVYGSEGQGDAIVSLDVSKPWERIINIPYAIVEIDGKAAKTYKPSGRGLKEQIKGWSYAKEVWIRNIRIDAMGWWPFVGYRVPVPSKYFDRLSDGLIKDGLLRKIILRKVALEWNGTEITVEPEVVIEVVYDGGVVKELRIHNEAKAEELIKFVLLRTLDGKAVMSLRQGGVGQLSALERYVEKNKFTGVAENREWKGKYLCYGDIEYELNSNTADLVFNDGKLSGFRMRGKFLPIDSVKQKKASYWDRDRVKQRFERSKARIKSGGAGIGTIAIKTLYRYWRIVPKLRQILGTEPSHEMIEMAMGISHSEYTEILRIQNMIVGISLTVVRSEKRIERDIPVIDRKELDVADIELLERVAEAIGEKLSLEEAIARVANEIKFPVTYVQETVERLRAFAEEHDLIRENPSRWSSSGADIDKELSGIKLPLLISADEVVKIKGPDKQRETRRLHPDAKRLYLINTGRESYNDDHSIIDDSHILIEVINRKPFNWDGFIDAYLFFKRHIEAAKELGAMPVLMEEEHHLSLPFYVAMCETYQIRPKILCVDYHTDDYRFSQYTYDSFWRFAIENKFVDREDLYIAGTGAAAINTVYSEPQMRLARDFVGSLTGPMLGSSKLKLLTSDFRELDSGNSIDFRNEPVFFSFDVDGA